MLFNKEQHEKYKNSNISETGYLAFKDIGELINTHQINMASVLDLGCGFGRSTRFLLNFTQNVMGMDLCEKSVHIAKNNITTAKFYVGYEADTKYQGFPYTAIFSFFTIFHFESELKIKKELLRCFNSLKINGHLLIVGGTKNLYTKKYLSVSGLNPAPRFDGDKCKIVLKHIDCVVEDYFWSELAVKKQAEDMGFYCCSIHHPLGDKSNQKYEDETLYAPYYILILQKKRGEDGL